MLTIHTPIALTVDPSMLRIKDNFSQRLTGNYQLIGNGIEPEDMLHFVSQPPEIYLAEGGMTALVDNNNIYENRNLKFEVINNVLNRVLVSDTYQMTYQDRVFIESVLKKMGVTDVREFVSHVQNFRQEAKNINRLTELYWTENEMLSQLIEYRQLQSEGKGKDKETEEKDEAAQTLWLHQQIMNRLQTGALYQELRNYIYMSSGNHQVISSSEMQIAEQTVVAQNILLNKLRNYTMMEEQPLIYHHINAYENAGDENLFLDNRQSVSRMVQAVLLNALHQMYSIRTDELLRQDNVWYQLAGAVYQATENTFKRFETNHNQSFLTGRDADVYSKVIQQNQKNEIEAIEQLFVEGSTSITNYTKAAARGAEELTYLHEEEDGEEPGSEVLDAEGNVIVQNIKKTEKHGQQIQALTYQETLLKNRLEQINQSNVQNQQLLQQLSNITVNRTEINRINRERAREDALRVLSEQDEVITDYLESHTVSEERQVSERERLVEIFGEETIRIFETLEKYQKSNYSPEVAGINGQGEIMLMRDIKVHEQEQHSELVHRIEDSIYETINESSATKYRKEYLPEHIRQIRQESPRQIERVEMVHRQEENVFEEEMLEEIRGMHRASKVVNEHTTEHVVEKNIFNETVNSRVNEFQVKQNEEIARLISSTVQQELGNLSEQVYGKLEKRMDTERRRRGL